MAESGDTLIVISGSGNSSNIIRAVSWALDNDMKVICMIGNKNAKILKFKGINSIVIPTDMQHSEDWHLILGHMICQIMMNSDS